MPRVQVFDVNETLLDLAAMGPALPAAGGGLGLHAMGERVAALSGSLAVESTSGEGTTIAVVVPAPAGENEVEPTERASR